MSVVRIREAPYYRGFFKKKCMRILSVHGKLSVIERCPYWFTVVSIQSRFDTSRFDTNQSRFDTNVKSFRYTSKVDSIQTEVSSIQPLFT